MKKLYLLLLLLIFIGCIKSEESQEIILVQVNAGEIDRSHSIVAVRGVPLKNGVNYTLKNSEGQLIPVQKKGDELIFLLKDLRANESLLFELIESDATGNKLTNIHFWEDAVEFSSSSGNPGFQYRTGVGGLDPNITNEVFYRSGYLHPVFTPGGRTITEHYTENRPHQNGIWTGWYNTEWNGLKPDFWSQANRTGKIDVASVNKIVAGPIFGELQTTHHFNEIITDNSSTILSDEWTVRFYNDLNKFDRPVNVIDLDVVQTNISEHPFRLIEHVYGGVGFRGNDQWIGDEMMVFLTSEGENRTEAHQSIAKWVAMSGEIDGEPATLLIFAHPDNLHFPERVFINAIEPFFTFAPLQKGDLTLKPGDLFKAKYRYITLDGNLPASDEIENAWNDYAYAVQASIINQ